MTFCGYNDTMAAGIKMLVEGMIEAMYVRHVKGVSVGKVVANELLDLRAMNMVLRSGGHGKSPELNDGLIAINLFADLIFSMSQRHVESFDKFADACRINTEEFIDLVRRTEDRHQAELVRRDEEPGSVAAIEAVARWLLGAGTDAKKGAELPQES